MCSWKTGWAVSVVREPQGSAWIATPVISQSKCRLGE